MWSMLLNEKKHTIKGEVDKKMVCNEYVELDLTEEENQELTEELKEEKKRELIKETEQAQKDQLNDETMKECTGETDKEYNKRMEED